MLFEDSLQNITLEDIRQRGQKPNYKTSGNWLARKWARPTAIYGSWLVIRLGLSANLVTCFAALSWLGEAIALSTGHLVFFIFGVILGFIGFWLDHVDGQVARVTKTTSPEGIFLDFWMHSAHSMTRAFGLGLGCYFMTRHFACVFAGMLMAFGWTMLSLANDAKYKSIFAILKNRRDHLRLMGSDENDSFACGFGRRRFNRMIRYYLLKLQEPHAVLMLLGLNCIFLLIDLTFGLLSLQVLICFWALFSPMLAVARVRRMILMQSVTSEFNEYFIESEITE